VIERNIANKSSSRNVLGGDWASGGRAAAAAAAAATTATVGAAAGEVRRHPDVASDAITAMAAVAAI
jgi:hypothetical protein